MDWESHARCILALFRLSYGLYTGDNACSELVRELQQNSPEFARWWSSPEFDFYYTASRRGDREAVAVAVSDSPVGDLAERQRNHEFASG